MKKITMFLLLSVVAVLISGCVTQPLVSKSNSAIYNNKKSNTEKKEEYVYVKYDPDNSFSEPMKTVFGYDANDENDPINIERERERSRAEEISKEEEYKAELFDCLNKNNSNYAECYKQSY